VRLLDLFCGAGGAAMGYHRAGFDQIVGVDIKPQPHYPFEFIQADALAPPVRLADFDAVHASPPCQGYVMGLRAINLKKYGSVPDHPRLIEPTRAVLKESGLPYVIENVMGAPLKRSVTLCGCMFGLRVRRRRGFESNMLLLHPRCQHRGHDFVGIYGDHAQTKSFGDKDGYTRRPRASTIDEARTAMEIDWMDWHEIKEAIPPAYTEYIGTQLLDQLQRTGAAS
jgi:DNA (cytosine-5)-methyltransferase 1